MALSLTRSILRPTIGNYRVCSSVLGKDQFSCALNVAGRAPARWKHNTPLNTVVMFVPQQEAWVVERMGKFHRILDPGINILIPVLDKVKYVQSLKEIAIDIPQQTAISSDNVTINIDGVLYLRIMDPYKSSYGVEDPEFAVTQLAQTTMRSELGKISLDALFRERENLNLQIVQAINGASEAWGIQCMRYEIRDIKLPARVQEAMQMQVEAERKKRAAILESEGIKAADINVAEGKKQARILQSEAEKQELINAAEGAAKAVVAAGEARAKSIGVVAEALLHQNGNAAASLAVAEKYVAAFGELAKESNTLMLPHNAGDMSGMVAQAMTIYTKLNAQNKLERIEEKVEEERPRNPDYQSKLD
ncbi:stomatin-like protein 2, mitochondrial [Eurytemora carolleeae]|uniref:stomatin-like protein 2, mitochondrial n=1 Tax=Eurytemora carolleeae TaxID=1294199 RepID=UPI000C76B1F2|nr:stomatin-like protein 2, mitochondrial [Eurytemora carolleeae]|eukprot:XP_023338138.1 stomatin-like protein 2, mitochondrial [Eurytemora affinis]